MFVFVFIFNCPAPRPKKTLQCLIFCSGSRKWTFHFLFTSAPQRSSVALGCYQEWMCSHSDGFLTLVDGCLACPITSPTVPWVPGHCYTSGQDHRSQHCGDFPDAGVNYPGSVLHGFLHIYCLLAVAYCPPASVVFSFKKLYHYCSCVACACTHTEARRERCDASSTCV